MLVSPIILYDHPEIAEQSEGALYDSTEIDEILTLRVMTMTDEEKAQARATDPLAAQIIDRCDSMSPEAMQDLHGVLRNPHAPTQEPGLIPEVPTDVDWWDPMADTAVRPELDACWSTACGWPRAAGSGCGRRAGPMRRTSSSPTRSRASPRCTRTSTATSTSASSSRTIRPPTCTTGTAATCTSRRTRSNHSRMSARKEFEMDVVGWVAIGVSLPWSVVGGVLVGLRSIPDVTAIHEDPQHVDGRQRGEHVPNPGSRNRQHLPRGRRLRPRGDAPRRRDSSPSPRVQLVDYGIRGMHLAYDLLDGVATHSSSSTRSPIAGRPAHFTSSRPIMKPSPPQPVSRHTAWTRLRCSPRLTALGGTPPLHHRDRLRGRERRRGHGPVRPGGRRGARSGARRSNDVLAAWLLDTGTRRADHVSGNPGTGRPNAGGLRRPARTRRRRG